MSNITKREVVANFSWRYIEKFGSQVVGFIVSIVLARLMAPEAFGVVAIMGIFTTFLYVFVDSGFGNALIQKKDADNVDFSSVFYFNVVMCCVLYTLLFLVAPYIAVFYDNDQLTSLIRVASLTLIISGLRNVQQAYVSKNMLFKKFFIASSIALCVSAFLGVFFAYKGFGAWSIVIQQLSNTAICTLLLWFIVRWRPSFVFSLKRLGILFSYGGKLLAASLLDTLTSEIRSLLIGKVYTPADLAFYDRGKMFPYALISGMNMSLNSVIFPVLSHSQDNASDIKLIIRRTISLSLFFIIPIMVWLSVSAESIVLVLLTEKWLPCVIFLQILCLDSMFWPVISTLDNSIKSIGRSDIYLKIVFIEKVITICLLVISVYIDITMVAISSVVATFFRFVIMAYISHRMNHYKYSEQLHDILYGLYPAIFVGVAVYIISLLTLSPLWTLILQVVVGGGVFVCYGIVVKNEGFTIIKNIIIQRKNN